ncbi:lysozyme c-1-like [Anopheles cruzii]|uniref:lysozyme c-1-like n=1 Tax=Anopheles cruzii TaxID=68878 RepID=UPI0022EC9790|nr:lysozyme c-1-like [Anopheles cruzii]
MRVFLFALGLVLFGVAHGKTFTKCELARLMFNNGFPKSQLPDWMCLVQSESNFKSDATNKNTNGSTDYGLFQINNKYWCSSSGAGGDCKIACSALIDNDATDDLKCAKLIYNRQGFNAWYGWINKCQGKTLPTVAECF